MIRWSRLRDIICIMSIRGLLFVFRVDGGLFFGLRFDES